MRSLVVSLSFFAFLPICNALVFPTNVEILEDIIIPIQSEGKTIGSITAKKGQEIIALGLTNGEVQFNWRNYNGKAKLHQTTLNNIIIKEKEDFERDEKIKAANLENQYKKEIEDAQIQRANDLENCYLDAVYVSEYLEENRQYFPPEDSRTIDKILKINTTFIESYEKAPNDSIKQNLSDAFQKEWNSLVRYKNIYGFSYNGLLDRNITKPVYFNLFQDSLIFYYLQIGNGSFSTVCKLCDSDIDEILKSTITKIPTWSRQCKKDHLDTYKEIGSFYGVNLSFHSIEGGKFQYLELSLNGSANNTHLISNQTVCLDILNFMCLMQKMANREEIFKKRKTEFENAKRLE